MTLFLYLLFINALAFGMYWADKRAAIRRDWRIPEASLLAVGFIGGTVGAFAGQRILRHKTRKTSFQLAFWAVTCIQIYLLCFTPSWLAAPLHRIL